MGLEISKPGMLELPLFSNFEIRDKKRPRSMESKTASQLRVKTESEQVEPGSALVTVTSSDIVRNL